MRYGGPDPGLGRLVLRACGSFWTLCGSLLSQAAGPAGMALINCVGIAPAVPAITPFVVGVLKDWFQQLLRRASCSWRRPLLLTIALVTLVAAHQRATAVALEAS